MEYQDSNESNILLDQKIRKGFFFKSSENQTDMKRVQYSADNKDGKGYGAL